MSEIWLCCNDRHIDPLDLYASLVTSFADLHVLLTPSREPRSSFTSRETMYDGNNYWLKLKLFLNVKIPAVTFQCL